MLHITSQRPKRDFYVIAVENLTAFQVLVFRISQSGKVFKFLAVNMKAGISVFLVTVVVSASSSVREYNLKRSVKSLTRRETVKMCMWSIEGTRRPLRCIVQCLLQDTCASVLVKKSSERCSALSETPQPSTKASSGNATIIYTVRQRGRK